MMKPTLVLFFSIIASSVFAQPRPEFKEGYVVLLSGDTISGMVMDRDESAFGGLLSKVKFRNTKGRRKKYKPTQLVSYKRGENLFHSIWISTESQMLKQQYFNRESLGEKHFVKVVYRGSLVLYHWEYMDEDNSYIDYIPLIKKPESDELVRVTQGIFGLKRKRLAGYFADCPILSSAILSKEITSVDELITSYERNCSH